MYVCMYVYIYIYISVCVIEGIQLLTISWLADIVPFPDRRSLDNRAASLPNPQGWGMDGWNTEFVREWGIAPLSYGSFNGEHDYQWL